MFGGDEKQTESVEQVNELGDENHQIMMITSEYTHTWLNKYIQE